MVRLIRLGALGVMSATAWNSAAVIDRVAPLFARPLRWAALAAHARAYEIEDGRGDRISRALGWEDLGQKSSA